MASAIVEMPTLDFILREWKWKT